MNNYSLRTLSLALASLSFVAASPGCGEHDSSVGSSQLASESDQRGRGGSGGNGGSGGASGSGGNSGNGGNGGASGSGGDGDSCDGTVGKSFGEAYDCATGRFVASANQLSCEGWVSQCVGDAERDGRNVACLWNGTERSRHEATAGACAGRRFTDQVDENVVSRGSTCVGSLNGVQTGSGVVCTSNEPIFTEELECYETLIRCQLLAAQQPERDLQCEWEGFLLYANNATTCFNNTGGSGGSGGAGGSGGSGGSDNE